MSFTFSQEKCKCAKKLSSIYVLNLFHSLKNLIRSANNKLLSWPKVLRGNIFLHFCPQWIGAFGLWLWWLRHGLSITASTMPRIQQSPATRWCWWWFISFKWESIPSFCRACMRHIRRNLALQMTFAPSTSMNNLSRSIRKINNLLVNSFSNFSSTLAILSKYHLFIYFFL